MAQILIVAHAPLATSLLTVARHVYPDCSRLLSAIDVDAGEGAEQVEARLREALARLSSTGDAAADVLILADVFGATPCNAALAVADGVHVRVVAGVNVPMVWRSLCYAEQALEDLVARAVAGATQGVMQVAVPRRQNQPIPPGRDDQDQRQDQ